ncbi:type 2 DNA topoisomerase 6 subunit B-like isoform X1 [Alligator sinensis]|uniref:Type 2 DNA topoisomerase 6 subunit B-like isoform X1 n=1 Tax=Alligator sinensis TaxID=38654 RepID=A0A3Q0HGC7_ALLSI|nr:type 2 DNA topoisomerase 6 subunit B-like isoform X1 [Alligator sinensis]
MNPQARIGGRQVLYRPSGPGLGLGQALYGPPGAKIRGRGVLDKPSRPGSRQCGQDGRYRNNPKSLADAGEPSAAAAPSRSARGARATSLEKYGVRGQAEPGTALGASVPAQPPPSLQQEAVHAPACVHGFFHGLSPPDAPRPGPPGTPVPCRKLHPVLGCATRLLLPAAVAEAGSSGELSLVPAAALCPCLRPLPNQPAQLNTVSVFCYDPAGLPLPATFLRDPAHLADWERHGYVATPDPGPGPKEGLARPDACYLLHRGSGEAAEPGAQPQTLLLFLLLRYADPFQDPPVCDARTRQVLVSHVEQILGCSAGAVREAVQGVVDATLEEDAHRQRSQRQLCQALPVVLEAVSSVVSSSTSARFRRACLQSWQVSDTPELVAALSGALTGVTRRRRLPHSSCTDPGPPWAGSPPGQPPLQEEASRDIGTPRSEPAGEAAGAGPEPKQSRRASGTPEQGQSRDGAGSSQDLSQADELWLQETRSLSEWAS